MFSLSMSGFKEKPLKSRIGSLRWNKKDLSIDDLEYHIKNGYALTGIYSAPYPLNMKDRNSKNFMFTSFVMIDLDEDYECGLKELVESLSIPPTIAYTTFNHQQPNYGNRYRLFYVCDQPISSPEDYVGLYNYICQRCDLPKKLNDNCGRSIYQLCFGSRSDCEFFRTDNILNIKEIKKKEEYKTINSKRVGHSKNNKKPNKTLCSKSPTVIVTNEQYLKDYEEISTLDLFDKYDNLYPLYEGNMELPTVSDDEPIILIPQNYLYIKRISRPEPIFLENGNYDGYRLVPRKWKDGEGRRRKLFFNGILRRFIKEDITYEHLLHCLLKELYHFYQNHEDTITKEELKGIAQRVMATDLDRDVYQLFKENCQKCNPKFKVNKSYCNKYGIKPLEIVSKYSLNIKDEKRDALFIPEAKDVENARIFGEHGLGKDEKTVRRFRKRRGIKNFRERNKRSHE